MRVAREFVGGHGVGGAAEAGDVVEGEDAGVAGARGDIDDRKACGRVARCAAAGSVGRKRAPFWPHPAIPTELTTKTSALTRIRQILNMVKL